MPAWISQAQDKIETLGPAAPFAYVLFYAICTVLMIPGSALTLGAGALFGFKVGLLVSIAGSNGGALAAFLLARSILRRKVEAWASGRPRFAALDKAVALEGFKIVLLARLSPLFPFILLNYLLGLTPVTTGAYALANLFGMLPGLFLLVYLGSVAGSTAAGELGGWKLALQIIGLAATFLFLYWITQRASRALPPS